MKSISSWVVGLWLLTGTLMPPAAAQSPPPAFDHAGLAADVLDRHIRPRTTAFATSAKDLAARMAALCAAPDAAALENARAGFRDALLAYAHIEHLRFGPARAENRQERLLIYPDPKGLVRRQVEKALSERAPGLQDSASLRNKSALLQGFPALEIMLYRAERDGKAADGTLARLQDPARVECRYALAVAESISNVADDMARGWADDAGFARLMRTPGAGNAAYLRAEEVTLEIAAAFLNGLETVRDTRLLAPLGFKEFRKAPTRPIFDLSGLTLPYIAASIDGLLDLYNAGGLEQRIATADAGIASVIETELVTARDHARSITVPFAEAKTTESEFRKMIAMGFPMKNARSLAAELMTKATGLSIGFNAGDGD